MNDAQRAIIEDLREKLVDDLAQLDVLNEEYNDLYRALEIKKCMIENLTDEIQARRKAIKILEKNFEKGDSAE